MTMENELRQLIAESQSLLKKLRRILNTMIVIAGIIFIPFLYSFVEIQVSLSRLDVRLSELESSVGKIEPKDFYYRTFVQKVDALAVHMYEDQWINTQLYKITNNEEYKNSEARKILIEAMFNETHRGK